MDWDSPAQTASDSVSILVGGVPGLASLNGVVWHNVNFDGNVDGGEQRLQGWFVDVYSNNTLQGTVQTDANGVYQILLPPNDLSGIPYELRFRSPGAGGTTASLGNTTVTTPGFVTGPQQISNIIVLPDTVTTDMNLPIEPNGVVYESLFRTPVAGARLTMHLASSGPPSRSNELPEDCFDDTKQQGQVTLSEGHYKFDLNFSLLACPPGLTM